MRRVLAVLIIAGCLFVGFKEVQASWPQGHDHCFDTNGQEYACH